MAALIGLAATGCISSYPVSAAEAPALIARPGCSLWEGTVKGNDPNVAVEIELCEVTSDSEAVAGRIQFTSPRSGWSVREIEGRVTRDGLLVLRDFQFDVSAPELGWIFCLVDRYQLEGVGPDQLAGRYDSKECHDHGRIELSRVK